MPDQKSKNYFVWQESSQLASIPRGVKVIHVNFTPKAKDLLQLLRNHPDIELIQFTHAAFRRLSDNAHGMLELAKVKYRFGRLKDIKYPEKAHQYAISQVTSKTCEEIAREIREQYGVNVTRQIVWYWRRTGSVS